MDEFDIIVIGGGSAGCAAAARLNEDGKYSVCLIEAGGTNDNLWIKTPAFMPFLPKKSNYRYDTVPQAALNGRLGYQPRGRGLGGSSAINAMIYIRGNRWDYDNWAALGCGGWSYDDVLPYFKRSEGNDRFQGAGADDYHGSTGPLHVMDQQYANDGSHDFIEAAAQLQLPRTDDFNGANQEGFGLYQVNQKGGERWSASRAYIEPARGRKNFTVMNETLTQRILIENGRATGLQILRNGTERILKARGAVILSAGAFNSPQILMLSGIGPAAHLADHGINVVADRPSVGENLQDHIDCILSRRTKSKIFLGDSMAGNWHIIKAIIEHRIKRTGVMTSCIAEGGGFWKSSPDLPAPDIQYHFIPALLEDHGRTKLKGHGFSCHACVLRPESRGTVRISSNDAHAAPIIDPKFLSDERDLITLRAGMRQMYRIFNAPALAQYKGEDLDRFDIDDDAALDHFIRSHADTVYHPVGTCRMGDDPGAVVDTQLRVNGISGLYVADASIMPRLISGNTNAASIMIGEKSADLIRAHLG